MTAQEVLQAACSCLTSLSGHVFDVLTISKPVSPQAAVNLSKVISKLIPLVGNLIEFNTVEFLNDCGKFERFGRWLRQDPGFPDTIFQGSVQPTPGLEIKAWFPLATEITARFKDSQNHFEQDQTYVAMLAWVPEHLIYGKPYILDVVTVSGLSVAKARDEHYHNPPDYLVLEPEDTASRTRNLQQTNTNGYKFQSGPAEFKEAQGIVESWGPEGRKYKPSREYRQKLQNLIARYTYRLDTNYAKMDRIVHPGIEEFKSRVMSTTLNGVAVGDWCRLFSLADEPLTAALAQRLGIRAADSATLLA